MQLIKPRNKNKLVLKAKKCSDKSKTSCEKEVTENIKGATVLEMLM